MAITASKAQTVAGTVVSIALATPATYDNTGFSALTFHAIGETTDLGSFGKTYSLVSHNPVGARNTFKFRGSYNSGSLTIKMAKATLLNTDIGQNDLNTALASDASFSFRYTFQDGSKAYFTGKVMEIMIAVGSVNSILGADFKVELDNDIVESST